MSDISKIQTNGTTYDVKDATARETADSAQSTAETANSGAGIARNIAREAQETADGAQITADSKVSSVNIGTVTTGDEPSVTNSGTDKDVVMDFVFPSGGGGQDSRIVTGVLDDSEKVTIEGALIVFYGDNGTDGYTQIICNGTTSYIPFNYGYWEYKKNGDGSWTFSNDKGCRYIAIALPAE